MSEKGPDGIPFNPLPYPVTYHGYHPDLQRIASVFVECSHRVNACNY